MMSEKYTYILHVQCADKPGVVAAVATCLSNTGCNIEESAQFNDHLSGQFFMRVVFSPLATDAQQGFCIAFEKIADTYGLAWTVHEGEAPVKTIIMVSKEGHCLNNLLYRRSSGNLNIDIRAIVSNHETCRRQAENYDIPFHYLPVTKETKSVQEAALEDIVAKTNAELVVMARYMQILSPEICDKYLGRVINIHHSFLPGFKGANPYAQAYERGVKIIGATAHFATEDLDEGPIIEQDTVRITHAQDPDKLRTIGQDTEEKVLARAIRMYTERRIFLQGQRTVIL